jgi:hypothetical protein
MEQCIHLRLYHSDHPFYNLAICFKRWNAPDIGRTKHDENYLYFFFLKD